jgi:hypothetical protein
MRLSNFAGSEKMQDFVLLHSCTRLNVVLRVLVPGTCTRVLVDSSASLPTTHDVFGHVSADQMACQLSLTYRILQYVIAIQFGTTRGYVRTCDDVGRHLMSLPALLYSECLVLVLQRSIDTIYGTSDRIRLCYKRPL